MKESFWGYIIMLLGIMIVVIMIVIRDYQTTKDEDYYLIKEVLQDAMFDSLDYSYYREHNDLRIIEDKFAENFLRRFAENVNSSKTYKIQLIEVNENPPKASVRVTTNTGTVVVDQDEGAVDFGVVNILSGILDMKHDNVVYNNDGFIDRHLENTISRTYYTVAYVDADGLEEQVRSKGLYNSTYYITLNTFPEGVKLSDVKDVTVDSAPMTSYADVESYMVDKVGGAMFYNGNADATSSIKDYTVTNIFKHMLPASNYTTTGSAICGGDQCRINVSARITGVTASGGKTPWTDVYRSNGAKMNPIWFFGIKYTINFELREAR